MKSIPTLLKAISGAVMTILKSILFLFKSVWRAVFTLLFIGSLFVNVTIFAWSAGAVALSSAFKAVTGIITVITDLAVSKARFSADLADSKAKLAASEKQVGGLTKKIATRTSRGVVRSVAIIPAEAIPFIGPFTIVAVTGLEIKDACATMEDLRELNGLLDTGEDIDTGTVCGLDVPDLDTVIDKVKKSPKAAYESARSVDVPLPSWSDVNAIIKRGWGGILKNLDWIWKWLFGG